MILVTGASGQLGSAILAHLTTAGVPAIAGTRHPDPSSKSSPEPASKPEYPRIDFDNPASLNFTGVSTLVIVSAGTAEDDVVIARHERVIAAAERDRVGHLVYTSLTTAGDHLGFALAHRWTENRIRSGSISWTILRNGLYAELIAHLLTPIDGVITAPFGDGRVAAVARDDLALPAATIAATPQPHTGKIYDLVGSTSVTAAQIADRLGVPYRPARLQDLRSSLSGAGLQPFQPPMLVSIHSAIAGGFLGATNQQLEALIGREPQPPLTLILNQIKT